MKTTCAVAATTSSYEDQHWLKDKKQAHKDYQNVLLRAVMTSQREMKWFEVILVSK